MPSLSRITSTFFVDLINRLGVRPPPPEGFQISNVVQPVSIVDSSVPVQAIVTTQTLDGANSAGLLAAPGAGTVIADTGPLVAGTYSMYVVMGCDAIGANPTASFFLQRRDSANATNIWQIVGQVSSSNQSLWTFSATVRLASSERLRLITDAATGGTMSIQGNIWVQQLS